MSKQIQFPGMPPECSKQINSKLLPFEPNTMCDFCGYHVCRCNERNTSNVCYMGL